jgi:hypothetical protein
MRLTSRTVFLFLAVLSAVQILRSRQRRLRSITTQKHEALRAWEGEGGAVPVDSHRTAAAITPAHDSGRG